MKIHTEFQQNSLEWLTAKAGVLTASEAGDLFTGEMKPRTGDMPKTLLYRKLAEIWTGGPLPGGMTLNMEFGSVLEEEAIPWLEYEFNEPVRRVGFITADDERVGCSPDGLIADGGVEIKCPTAAVHCKYLDRGEVPGDYLPQVHFSMFVTGARWWKFVSYHRRFPKLVKVVERDEKIQMVIDVVVDEFLWALEFKVRRLEEMSGTPRPKRGVFLSETPDAETFDVIP